MNNNLSTKDSEETVFDSGLKLILKSGSVREKEFALLNRALSNENSLGNMNLFLKLIKDPELETIAFVCLGKLLAHAPVVSLPLVLPVLIKGLGSAKEAVRQASQAGLDSLIRPSGQREDGQAVVHLGVQLKPRQVQEYLESDSAEEIITALVYLYYKPHKDADLFEILDSQLDKNIEAVDCVVGAIVDTKLWAIIRKITDLSDLSLKTYARARHKGMKSKSSWVYRRFDSMRELAREHLKFMNESA